MGPRTKGTERVPPTSFGTLVLEKTAFEGTEQHLVALLSSTDYVTSTRQGTGAALFALLAGTLKSSLINAQQSPNTF